MCFCLYRRTFIVSPAMRPRQNFSQIYTSYWTYFLDKNDSLINWLQLFSVWIILHVNFGSLSPPCLRWPRSPIIRKMVPVLKVSNHEWFDSFFLTPVVLSRGGGGGARRAVTPTPSRKYPEIGTNPIKNNDNWCVRSQPLAVPVCYITKYQTVDT